MNLDQFTGFLSAPEKLDAQSLPLLTDLVKEYPYFQTAQVLLAKNLHNEKNIRYNAQLKIAAAYSADRKKLYELINGIAAEKVIVSIAKEEKPVLVKEEKMETLQEKPITVKPLEEIIKEEPFAKKKEEEKVEPVAEGKEIVKEKKAEPVVKKQEIKPEEKHTFSEWLKLASIHSVTAIEIEREKKKPAKKDELIEKFLREEPKINKPQKAEFFSPVNMAKQSIVEDGDLVTETLAQIYEKQGFYAKAIKAYEKLSLRNPEKKLSFAARIENLKQQLNEQ